MKYTTLERINTGDKDMNKFMKFFTPGSKCNNVNAIEDMASVFLNNNDKMFVCLGSKKWSEFALRFGNVFTDDISLHTDYGNVNIAGFEFHWAQCGNTYNKYTYMFVSGNVDIVVLKMVCMIIKDSVDCINSKRRK